MSRASAVRAGWALMGGRLVADALLAIEPDGRFGRMGPCDGTALPPGTLDLSSRIVVAGTCNAHSHAFQVLLRGRCETMTSFREWVGRRLQPLAQRLTEHELRAASRLAYTEMLLNGITSVGEFHYLNRGPGGEDVGNRLADAVIGAAREVGLRIVLLRSLYDRPEGGGRERFVEPVDVAVHRLDELDAAWAHDAQVSVAPAPHSIHGASSDALLAGHEWALRKDRPLHVHLAEQHSDVETARRLHATTPLRALERLGVVSPRLVAVHGCWLDAEEIALLGSAGGGLAYNPGSNMALGDGVTDLPAMLAAGVRVGLGTDGAGTNNQLDLFREMRAAEHLQRVRGRRMGVLTGGGGGRVLFDMATSGSAGLLGLRGGLQPGAIADLIALDPDDVSLQPLDLEGDPVEAATMLCNQLAFAVSPRAAVTHAVVGGQLVLADRRPTLVSPEEVTATVRSLHLGGAT